jgi:hypothetical protein
VADSYEVHITVPAAFDEETISGIAESYYWKFSKIAGDPVLGDAIYFYLTRHRDQYLPARADMAHMAETLAAHGIDVLRAKIEHVIFDTKAGDNM